MEYVSSREKPWSHEESRDNFQAITIRRSIKYASCELSTTSMKLTVKQCARSGLGLYILFFCLSAGPAGGCSTLPSLVNRADSTAIFNTGDTRLGRTISPLVDAHPGKSGIYPLPILAMRLPRERCWLRRRNGLSMFSIISGTGTCPGPCCSTRPCDAADRGVRVRLLLDDQRHVRTRPDSRRARFSPEHRSSAVQSVFDS